MSTPAEQQTILIVDDNPTNLGVIVDYLETHSFRIIVARDGETAIKRARFVQPDLILLDVMMPPGIDGFETCRRLKADGLTKDIPVIFMTALARVEDKVEGFSVGAVDYVTKPIQQEEVLARVTTHLTLQAQKKRLEAVTNDLLDANIQLAELNASKDKFFTIIAHDLRTPFNSLMGYAQLLLMEAKDFSAEEIMSIASDMHRSASTTYNLLQNLLNWALLQRGNMSYAPAPVYLREVVAQALNLHQETAKQKSISLTNDIAPDLCVFADENMIELVMRNLLSNSLKFTADGGKVSIWARVQGEDTDTDEVGRVYVYVADNGVGIAPYVVNKLFRLDEHYTTDGTRQEKGTGLGLLLCQEMVALHGGSITVNSSPDEGTVIGFSVPHSQDD
jgi:signal transduction histidine kinase